MVRKNDVVQTLKTVMPKAKWCKKGYTPLPFQGICGYIATSNSQEDVFGEYDSIVKEIIKEKKWYLTGVGEIGHRPHCRILPDDRGFCHFYDDKKDKCMLGEERPSRCE